MARKSVKKEEGDRYMFKHGREHNCKCCKGGWGGAYFLGFLGAAVYYLQQTTGFWNGVLAILKACVWPAFLVYKLLGI